MCFHTASFKYMYITIIKSFFITARGLNTFISVGNEPRSSLFDLAAAARNAKCWCCCVPALLSVGVAKQQPKRGVARLLSADRSGTRRTSTRYLQRKNMKRQFDIIRNYYSISQIKKKLTFYGISSIIFLNDVYERGK